MTYDDSQLNRGLNQTTGDGYNAGVSSNTHTTAREWHAEVAAKIWREILPETQELLEREGGRK